MSHLFPNTHTSMNRQSQQLVVAGVVAFLPSGVITLAGLSTAQMSMPSMDGGGGGGYMPPAGGGDMGGGGGFQGGDMQGGGGFQGGDMQGGGGFQGDGMDFQRDGATFQKDGAGFRPGAPDFEGETGADRGFSKGFEGKEGMERAGWRFERKPMGGSDNMKQFGGQKMQGEGEDGVFGKGTSYPMKGGQGDKDGIFGKGGHSMKGATGGFNGEDGPRFDMNDFDQFVPKKSSANVDSLLDSLPESDSDAASTLTAAQERKVEKTLDKADAAEEKATSGLQKIFAKKPTKSAATKATNHILTLVKQWVSVQKLADGLGDYESDVVDHAEGSAASFSNTIVEACDAASDFFDGKWKGEAVCDKVMDQMDVVGEE